MNMCEKICRECPFAKKSAPGWLGPHTVKSLMGMMQMEHLFACHKQIKDDTREIDLIRGNVQLCRGFVASATKSHKMFGSHINNGRDLRLLQLEITGKEMETVLDRREFREHHEKYE